MRVLIHHGHDRSVDPHYLAGHDIVLTTFETREAPERLHCPPRPARPAPSILRPVSMAVSVCSSPCSPQPSCPRPPRRHAAQLTPTPPPRL